MTAAFALIMLVVFFALHRRTPGDDQALRMLYRVGMGCAVAVWFLDWVLRQTVF